MTTTAAIRDVMVTTVKGLTPTVNSQRGFEPHVERVDFVSFCEANPQRAFRLFSIRDTFEREGPTVTNTDVEQVSTTLECRIGYPHDFRYGGQMALDRDDCIEADIRLVRNAIGVNGYLTIETGTAADACVFGEDVSVERGTSCDFAIVRLRVTYYEVMP